MAERWFAALFGAVWVGCAPGLDTEEPLEVVDLRDAGAPGGGGRWEGDDLIVDTPCLDLAPLAGHSLDEACDMLMGGEAHTGEDRLAATVFDDLECWSAAGFLPPVGQGGEVVLPSRGRGVVLRCRVEAEPR